MTDVNERTEQRYEPHFGDKAGAPEGQRYRGLRGSRFVAMAVVGALLLAFGLSSLAYGLFWLAGPRIALVVLGLLVLRGAFRMRRRRSYRMYGGRWHALHAHGCGPFRSGPFEDHTFV